MFSFGYTWYSGFEWCILTHKYLLKSGYNMVWIENGIFPFSYISVSGMVRVIGDMANFRIATQPGYGICFLWPYSIFLCEVLSGTGTGEKLFQSMPFLTGPYRTGHRIFHFLSVEASCLLTFIG
jgi:hypothetical protein